MEIQSLKPLYIEAFPTPTISNTYIQQRELYVINNKNMDMHGCFYLSRVNYGKCSKILNIFFISALKQYVGCGSCILFFV